MDSPTPPQLPLRLEKRQLTRILEEAMIYQCACPAQVAQTLLQMRESFRYQHDCGEASGDTLGIHARIMRSLEAAHAELESCLLDVLTTEGWDLQTMTMPPGLRQRRDDALRDED